MSNLLKYDVIYILDPGATPEEMTAVSAKVEQITADAKGTVLKKDDWGKRRLSYAVKKHRDGHYIFFHLQLSTDGIAEVTRNLRLLEKVIKFSVVKDTISHLKAKVKPVRTGKSLDTSGAHSSHQRSGPSRHMSSNRPSSGPSGSSSSHSSHSSPAPVNPSTAPAAVPAAAPAPVAAPAPEVSTAPSTTTTNA